MKTPTRPAIWSRCAPAPPFKDSARWGLVTLSNKAEALSLPEIRQLMLRTFRSLDSA